MDVEINDLSKEGLILDQPAHHLPPEALTRALNMRVKEGCLLRVGGRTQVFGTPTVAPYFAVPCRTPALATIWAYFSLTKAYAYDFSNHVEITNAGGDYTTANGFDWNHTFLGGIPIFNNGVDEPQMWSSIATGTALTNLTNWTSGNYCRVMRALGPHLVAIGPTLSSTYYPHAVLWSHPADPGAVPTSWDYTDETVDAGLNELPDAHHGILLDAHILRGLLYLYKEGSTWAMRFVGGRPVFHFTQFSEASGVLCARCVADTGDGKWHFVATQDDIIVHNDTNLFSVVENRLRRSIFNAIDTTNYRQSFVFDNTPKKEMWFCYPEGGESTPSRALIWNYGVKSEVGVVTEAEVDGLTWGIVGNKGSDSGEVWDDDTEVWDDDEEPWETTSRGVVIVTHPGNTKIYQLDDGTTYDGTNFTGTVQRESLGMLGRRRNGEPIVDFTVHKFVKRMWVKARGGPINVRLGVQSVVGGDVTWSAVQEFDPENDLYVDFTMHGIAISVEFSAMVDFEVDGYRLEVVPSGRF